MMKMFRPPPAAAVLFSSFLVTSACRNCLAETGTVVRQESAFGFSMNRCPTLGEVAKDDWEPESLSEANLLDGRSRELLELKFFTGGTGGYWEEYYSPEEEGFRPVTESFVESAASLIPTGFERRRVRISIPDMKATIFLARKADPNCCPSGRLELEVALKGNDLGLLRGRFREDSGN